MVTSGHSYLDNRIFYKEAKSLKNAGYEVSIIAPMNNEGYLLDSSNQPYFKCGDDPFVDSGINVIGYTKTYRKIKNENIEELRYKIHLDFKNNIINNKIDDLEINLINKGMEIDADIYHAHEISSIYAAVKIKQLKAAQGKKVKVIYDVHEYFPSIFKDMVATSDQYKALYEKMIIEFERTVLPWCDSVITVSESIKDYLVSLNKNKTVHVIRNVPLKKELSSMNIENEFPVICYEGHIRFERGLKEILIVAEELKKRYSQFKLVLVGEAIGEEKKYLEDKIEEKDLNNFIIQTGWLTPDKAFDEISKCDIGLQLLIDIPNCQFALPNKLFNYMRAGLAIVGMNYKDISSIMRSSNCGMLIEKLDSNLLLNSLINLIEQKKLLWYFQNNARNAYEKEFNWSIEEEYLLDIYRLLSENDR
jgi:glycosyltransferase involved in cell wall biosynthesis